MPEHPALRSVSLDDMPRFVRPMLEFILLVSVYLGCIIMIMLAGIAVVFIMSGLSAGDTTDPGPGMSAIAHLLK